MESYPVPLAVLLSMEELQCYNRKITCLVVSFILLQIGER